MQITSSAFKEGEPIPAKYTCDGENISPPLAWRDAPRNTKTFALIVHDPDAPAGDWVHWVVYHIPANVTELSEHAPPTESLPNGAMQGRNDFKKIGYGGPCPPSGTHRYYFRLYALDADLPLHSGATRKDVENAMRGHVAAEAALIGKYMRRK
jgi:Raf kinase inhibitor-like YbhB/YbcL family protein